MTPDEEQLWLEGWRNAARRASGSGADGVTLLLDFLESEDQRIQVIAIEALAESEDERVLPTLLNIFRRSLPARSSRLRRLLGTVGALGPLAFGALVALMLLSPQAWVPVLATVLCCFVVGFFACLSYWNRPLFIGDH